MTTQIGPSTIATNGAALPHFRVGPLAVFDGTLDDAAGWCLDRVRSGEGAKVATANLDFIALARTDAQLRDDLRQSTLVIADGAPVAALARFVGATRTRRAAGVDLVRLLCEQGASEGLRVAFYGGQPDVAARAASTLETSYPGVQVVEQITPPFGSWTPADRLEDGERLAAADPDLVLVALGCPKQERVIAEFYDAHPRAVWIGVGGTLDFVAGQRRRAPELVQRAGLEWTVRFAQEPRRLWRRYLLRDVPALTVTALDCAGDRLRSRRSR